MKSKLISVAILTVLTFTITSCDKSTTQSESQINPTSQETEKEEVATDKSASVDVAETPAKTIEPEKESIPEEPTEEEKMPEPVIQEEIIEEVITSEPVIEEVVAPEIQEVKTSISAEDAKNTFSEYYPDVSIETCKLQGGGSEEHYYLFGMSGNKKYKMKVRTSDGSVLFHKEITTGRR